MCHPTSEWDHQPQLVGGLNHLEKYEFVNGKDYPTYYGKQNMFEITNHKCVYPRLVSTPFPSWSLRRRSRLQKILAGSDASFLDRWQKHGWWFCSVIPNRLGMIIHELWIPFITIRKEFCSSLTLFHPWPAIKQQFNNQWKKRETKIVWYCLILYVYVYIYISVDRWIDRYMNR